MKIDFYDILKESDDYAITLEEIIDAENRTSLNAVVSDYLLRIHEDYSDWDCLGESQRILDCSNKWLVDHYVRSNISDIRFVSHCRSKFCLHCQKLLQVSRLARFDPLLSGTAETHDLYHITFTVPNVPGVKLKVAVQCIFHSFRRLMRYFSLGKSHKGIRGVDFRQYGFHAAIRSLEITYGKRFKDDFHPHIHCIFALKKGLNFVKYRKNVFSYDYGDLVTYFSDFEILLQKVWRLIYDSEWSKCYNSVITTAALGKPLPVSHPDSLKFSSVPKQKARKENAVTKEAIDSLDLGYSVRADLIKDNDDRNPAFREVFKYACKCTSEESQLFTYDQFKYLYFALQGAHVVQGYGEWYRFNPDEEDKSLGEWYKVFVSWLRTRETPLPQILGLLDVKKAIEDKTTVFITRRSIKQWLKRSDETRRAELDDALNGVTPCEPDKPRYFSSSFATAYSRYLTCRRESSLFADIREREEKARAEKTPLILSPEQLSFLDSIF